MKNWAGNLEYSTQSVHYPQTVGQVRELVGRFNRLRALGTRHSFNDIADSPAELISTSKLNRIVSLDANSPHPTVTVEAGITYGALCAELHRSGFALHNLASLPHISVGGAVATATHGSGDRNGSLSTAVVGMQIVGADGELAEVSRQSHGETFDGMVVSLGALGVVTQLTLKISPSYSMRQEVFENLPMTALREHFEEITSSAYSVSFFTDWNAPRINQVWLKRRESDLIGFDLTTATRATRNVHPLIVLGAENCTEQMNVPGAWYERLPHFRMDFTPSAGEELQTEYFVPREHALDAIDVVFSLREQIAPMLQISEIRTIAADELWMSPCYRQACVGIHFTWKPDWPGVRRVLPVIESNLEQFGARPHWGKLFTMSREQLQGGYAKMPEFRKLMFDWDPRGKFRNGFIERFVA
jgi:xylitol oxidase